MQVFVLYTQKNPPVFEIDVNSMVLELVVMATVDAGAKPKNQSNKQKKM